MCAALLTDPQSRAPADAGPPRQLEGLPSLLSPGRRHGRGAKANPHCLIDLHLDDIISAMAPGEFQAAVWRAPLSDAKVVEYRQDVVADLTGPALRRAADEFVAAMASTRASITAKAGAHYARPAELNLLEAVSRFGAAVDGFALALAEAGPHSTALSGVAEAMARYVQGTMFRSVVGGALALLEELRGPAVELGIQSGTVWADHDSGRPGWAQEIDAFFARFDSANGPATAVPARPRRYLNHVEAQAIDLVAGLRPEPFEQLHAFVLAHEDFLPAELEELAEELRFFLGFLKVACRLEEAGVAWSRPQILPGHGGPLELRGLVDLALALRQAGQRETLVSNDLRLGRSELVAFITGPNQGGKTTFARAVGQVAYLASLGLPVPARSAKLPLLNPVLTHFPQQDDTENQRGGLADEVSRLHEVLTQANSSTLLVLNELFSATSAEDAFELSELAVQQFLALGCRVLWVTFLEELVTSVEGAASLVGQVAADDPTRPTFQFRPQPPAGRSHAAALAARHGLSSDDLARRLA